MKLATWLVLVISGVVPVAAPGATPHNLILFVPDGLRSQIVDAATAPAMAQLRATGVDFRNSHALFPTFTTANASAFATGHGLGDTGDFSNYLYAGFRVTSAGATVTPFLESDPVLRQVNDNYNGNYLDEPSIVTAARAQGYATGLIGKLGPAAIFDLGSLKSGATLIVDDSTGSGQEVPLSDEWKAAFLKYKVAPVTPSRGDNGNPGGYSSRSGFIPGTFVPNLAQQQYFTEVAVKVALPHFRELDKPFVMVFWSRDPDGTQHFHGESLDRLTPGINGATSLSAIRAADTALAAIEAALESLKLAATTDIVVVADHGFSTIAKDRGVHSPSVHPGTPYGDVPPGELPPGFIAIDLYASLKRGAARLKLFDPDDSYRELDWTKGAHPLRGNAILAEDPDQPQIIVAANGGSDLIYLPESAPAWGRSGARAQTSAAQKELAARIVAVLLGQDYVSGIFVDESRFGRIPGALSTGAISLGGGAAVMPHPAIVVSFASRVVADCRYREATLCTAEVADTPLLQGQGMHGSFSRADTWNFMAARGPDFRAGFVDPLPASNADIGMTIAHLLGLALDARGKLAGRVLKEALTTSPGTEPLPPVASSIIRSDPDPRYHLQTLLRTQTVDGHVYFDAAGFPDRTVGLAEARPATQQ